MRYHDFKEEYFTDISLSKNKETTSKHQKEIQPQIDEVNSIKIKMTKKNLENSCIKLVTVNERALIVNPIKSAIKDKYKQKISISSESIQKKFMKKLIK